MNLYELTSTTFFLNKKRPDDGKKEGKKTQADTDTDSEDKSRAVSKDEGGLLQKMFTELNNVSVVSAGHGIEPPGVSHWPIGLVLRLGPGEQRADTERSFLSHILLKRRTGLAFP